MAQVTLLAVLGQRNIGQACASGQSLCPESMNGGCCPVDYTCAKDNCYATAKAPSTCLGKVGWSPCAAVYGAGCCPDGYKCGVGDACLPPSGTSYTYACPSSHYLCPESASYGCCPNGMSCAVNQCYSTTASSQTMLMEVTSTRDGKVRTRIITATQTIEPAQPTELPIGDSSNGQRALKYFPAVVPKEQSTAKFDQSSRGRDLSTTALGCIIAGAIAFLVLILTIAYLLTRHLNRMFVKLSPRRHPNLISTGEPAAENLFKDASSEVEHLNINPLMSSPRPTPPSHFSCVECNMPDHPECEEPYPEASALSSTPTGQAASPASQGHKRLGLGLGLVRQYFNIPQRKYGNRTSPSRTVSDDSGISFWMAGSNRSETDRSVADPQGSSSRYWRTRRKLFSQGNKDNTLDARTSFTAGSASELEARWYVPELAETSQAVTRDERRKASTNAGNLPELVKREMEKRQKAPKHKLGIVNEDDGG